MQLPVVGDQSKASFTTKKRATLSIDWVKPVLVTGDVRISNNAPKTLRVKAHVKLTDPDFFADRKVAKLNDLNLIGLNCLLTNKPTPLDQIPQDQRGKAFPNVEDFFGLANDIVVSVAENDSEVSAVIHDKSVAIFQSLPNSELCCG